MFNANLAGTTLRTLGQLGYSDLMGLPKWSPSDPIPIDIFSQSPVSPSPPGLSESRTCMRPTRPSFPTEDSESEWFASSAGRAGRAGRIGIADTQSVRLFCRQIQLSSTWCTDVADLEQTATHPALSTLIALLLHQSIHSPSRRSAVRLLHFFLFCFLLSSFFLLPFSEVLILLHYPSKLCCYWTRVFSLHSKRNTSSLFILAGGAIILPFWRRKPLNIFMYAYSQSVTSITSLNSKWIQSSPHSTIHW